MKLRTGCALLGLVAVFGAMYGVYRAQNAPQVGGSVPFSQLSPEQKEAKRQSARQLETQVEELARSARKGEKKPFALVVKAEDLNTLLQSRLDTSKFPIRDPRVGMSPDQLQLQGKVLYKGFEGVVTLAGKVIAQNGQLVFEADSLQIGGLPAPSEWKAKAETEISKQLNNAIKKAPGRIDSVAIEQDQMTISGITD